LPIASRSVASGGGFPGLAIGSLVALLAMLAAAGLLSVRPWESSALAPHLSVSPGVGIALGDSTPVAQAQAADDAGPRLADARPATLVANDATRGGGSASTVGISSARKVSSPASAPTAPPTGPSPTAEPVALPVSGPETTTPAPPPAAPLRVEANFENDLKGWSTSAAGDRAPMIATDIVRDGSKSSVVRLTGREDRSELILGGDGGSSGSGAIKIREGEEFAFAFSFYIQTMVYGRPGADNVIMQFKSDASDTPAFGLQLLDYPGYLGEGGGRGLWSSGEAMGGYRFLAPASESAWHDVVIHCVASSLGHGFYEVYLDGEPIDARAGADIIAPGSDYAQIEVGLFRDGDLLPGTSEIRLDAAKLGDTLDSVLP
jgi:Polysaccharide lyase